MDLYPFKGYFSPFGFKLNDWATLAICILPFPLISTVLLRKNPIMYLLGAVSTALTMYGVLISFSRGAYLALVLYIGLVLWFTFYYRLISIKQIVVYISICSFILGVLCYPIASSIGTTVSMNQTTSQQRSITGRVEILKDGVDKISAYPWFGRGGYNFAKDTTRHTSREDAGISHFANNLYLQIVVEKGWGGLFSYGVLFLSILFGFYKGISTTLTVQYKQIQILLFAGFCAYCFREIFFASFFENDLVLIIIGIYFALSGAWRPSALSVPSRYIKVLMFFLFISLTCWLFNKKFNYSASKQDIQSSQILNGDKDLAIKSIEKAIYRTPDVASYYALAGLNELQDSFSIQGPISKTKIIDTNRINKSIHYFNQALFRDSYQSNYYFNLACLYTILDPSGKDVSSSYFEKSIEMEGTNSEYLIGYGLWLENKGDTSAAFKLYQRAIRIDPEIIESAFYQDLVKRIPATIRFIKDIIQSMNLIPSNASSPIISARLAKLKLFSGDTAGAQILYREVIRQMPDLSRPYCDLGCIMRHSDDSLQAIEFYKKSLYLNSNDYLTLFALADYYSNNVSDPQSKKYADYYLSKGLDQFRNMSSQSFALSQGKLQDQYYPKNDMIYYDLPVYIRSTGLMMDVKSKLHSSGK